MSANIAIDKLQNRNTKEFPFAVTFAFSKIMQQEQTEWFECWFNSPYYRLLYEHRDSVEAKDFIDKLLQFLQPATDAKMLDIACGEGRHSVQLAEHGFDVVGIDLSSSSIAFAKKHETEHLQFFVHDMRLPLYINYFDFAFNFFTSFGYFQQERDNHLAAQSFAKSLKKNGILVVDYLNKNYSCSRLIPFQKTSKGGIDFSIQKELTNTHFLKEISFVDFEGKQRIYHEKVAAFSLQNFTEIFEKAGLKLDFVFGNYHLEAYDENKSPRMIMVFKKQ